MEAVNEKQTATLSLSFYNENNQAVTPTEAWYSIIDLKSGTVIKARTEFVPSGTTQNLVITSEENRIIDSENDLEKRLVTIEWNYGTGSKGTDEVKYLIRNLKGIQ
jgi:hypothetical protein